MGIKGFRSYLQSQSKLKHTIRFTSNNTNIRQSRKIIIWDALGFMRRLFGWYDKSTKLLFDLSKLDSQIKHTIKVFDLYGFELVAFIDGYHIDAKHSTHMQRLTARIKKFQKNIHLIKQLHKNDITKEQQTKIIEKLDFCPSSGYSQFLANSLRSNDIKVYLGTGKHDIDQDIATYSYLNKKVYGIISGDTDFFGFYNLPKHIKLINEYQ
eukprot:504209_1